MTEALLAAPTGTDRLLSHTPGCRSPGCRSRS